MLANLQNHSQKLLLLVLVLTPFLMPDASSFLLPLVAGLSVVIGLVWIFEIYPLWLSGFILLLWHAQVIQPSLGNELYSKSELLQPFFSNVTLLFLGGFVLSATLNRHGLDQWLAEKTLRPFCSKPRKMIAALLLLSAFSSMWISNTAAAAMLIGLCLPLVRLFPKHPNFGQAFLAAVVIGCNLGGFGTPIGTPPNAIVLASLAQLGHDISFLKWTLYTWPVLSILLLLAGFFIVVYFKIPATTRDVFVFEENEEPHVLTKKSRHTLMLFFFSVALFLGGSFFNISSATSALVVVILCFGLDLLPHESFRELPWDVLFLISGGLLLGQGITKVELDQWILDHFQNVLSPDLIVPMLVLVAAVFTSFISNTAAASIVIPVVAAGGSHWVLSLWVALLCSATMPLPVSTPPNAIAYNSGLITNKTLATIGIFVGGISYVVGYCAYNWLLKTV